MSTHPTFGPSSAIAQKQHWSQTGKSAKSIHIAATIILVIGAWKLFRRLYWVVGHVSHDPLFLLELIIPAALIFAGIYAMRGKRFASQAVFLASGGIIASSIETLLQMSHLGINMPIWTFLIHGVTVFAAIAAVVLILKSTPAQEPTSPVDRSNPGSR